MSLPTVPSWILLALTAVTATACGSEGVSTGGESSGDTVLTGTTTASPTTTGAVDPSTTTVDPTTVDPTTVDPTTEATQPDTGTGDSSTGAHDPTDVIDSSTGDEQTGTSSTGGEACESDDRAVKLGKLVSPKDGTVLENAIVVVHGDRISYVGTDARQIPCGAEIVDWSGYTGMPGLVDAHTHFAYQSDLEPGTTAWERADWLHNNDPQALVTAARAAALATVKTGVTTTIDKGAGGLEYVVADLKKEIDAGDIPGPRIFHSWKGIWWYDGFTLSFIKSWVDHQVLNGAHLIKIWADGCSDQVLECTPYFTADELTQVIDHAHALGRRVAVHAYHADTARLAILAGADSIEHPEGLGEDDFFDMIDKNVTYVPTIAHNQYYAENLDVFGYPPELVPQLEAYIALNVATLTQAHAAGVKIAMGSDSVFTGFGQNTRELAWLVQAGLTPMEALRAATVHGAESIGVEDEIGSVEVGYYADLVAVEGDPLADIDVVIHGVVAVMKGGELVEP